MLDSSNGIRDCSFPDFFRKPLTLKPCELFGVINSPGYALVVQDDRRRYDRTRKGPATHFIGSRDGAKAVFYKPSLEPEGAGHD